MTLPATSYVLLGLLDDAARSAYELAAFADSSIAHFWPVPRSQLYRELQRLEEIGLVSGTAIAQQRRPDKRVFELTAAGRQALREWLDEPGYPPDRQKNGLLVKLFFAGRASPEQATRLLTEYGTALETSRQDLAAIADRLDGRPDVVFPWLTALYGLRRVEAALGWLEEAGRALDAATAQSRRQA